MAMMRGFLIGGLCMGMAFLPGRAAAQCANGPECIQRWVGPIRVDPIMALVTGVVAAPIIVAGGFVTAAKMAGADKEIPAGVVPPAGPKQRATLTLIPTEPAPPTGRVQSPDERAAHEQAVRVNDAITNVALAVGGAAVITGIVYGIVKKK
jgi:hypothetical protein